MKYLITSSSTWECEDRDFASLHHGLLDMYNKNCLHFNGNDKVEGSKATATPKTCVIDLSDSSNISTKLSQGHTRKRRASAVSGEWYRRMCLQAIEWDDHIPVNKQSKKVSSEKASVESVVDVTVGKGSGVAKPHLIVIDGQVNQAESDSSLHNPEDRPHEEVFSCNICSKTFKSKHRLREHTKVEHTKEWECRECGKCYVGKARLALHMSVHSEDRPHKCDTCGKRFKTKPDLRRHSKIHTGATPFKCSYCDKTFALSLRRNYHEATHDQTLRTFCDICGTSFARASDLTRHKKVKHSSLGNPFPCKLCDKGFVTELNLKDHLNSHTGETPYECDICGKKYKAKSVLVMHRKSHVPEAERPLKCECCTARFWTNSELFYHMEVHHLPIPPASNVFLCTGCNSEFADEKERDLHRKCHLMCTICLKKFKSRKNLHDHMKVHEASGEVEIETPKIYPCKVCKMEFTDKKMRTIHHIGHIKTP